MPESPASPSFDARLLDSMIAGHLARAVPRYERLWSYYRNPTSERTAEPAQAAGLPARLRGEGDTHERPRRERVIENDIAWRIHAMVDFMFGRAVSVQSMADDPARARTLGEFLRAVFHVNGGVRFFQDLALLGNVYGFVDVLVRVAPGRAHPHAAKAGEAGAAQVVLETLEAPRVIPVLNADDYRKLDAYLLHVRQRTHHAPSPSFLARVRDRVLGGGAPPAEGIVERTQVWTPQRLEHYRTRHGAFGAQRKLEASEVNRLGRIPMVHIQNLPQPFFYEGLSEVEPLMGLQDELNTRLSDRANRVTFQSFKMYLGKGIEQFHERPVGPGQMWSTENTDASIEAFGGDAHSPSEEAHISEIREALDKSSGVPPVAAGLLRDRVGNLTSENALRIVMMGLLAKTEKKRVTYGAGLQRLCELILHAADVHGLLPNRPEERRVRIDWPNPLPDSEAQRLRNAQRKLEIGVPREQVLAELGYATSAA